MSVVSDMLRLLSQLGFEVPGGKREGTTWCEVYLPCLGCQGHRIKNPTVLVGPLFSALRENSGKQPIGGELSVLPFLGFPEPATGTLNRGIWDSKPAERRSL